tara:strand:- start:1541 stop:1813 length:273 start_codon:yes stop_codon:yes gene_type:complete
MENKTTYTVGSKTFCTKKEAEDYSIYLTKKVEVKALLSEVLPEKQQSLYPQGFRTGELAERLIKNPDTVYQIWALLSSDSPFHGGEQIDD